MKKPKGPLEERQADMRKREMQRLWRQKKRSQGFCGMCFAEKAGGDGGTTKLCPGCAGKYRARAEKVNRNKVGKVGRPEGSRNFAPERKAVVDLLIRREELRSKMNPMRVTFADIRRQAVC